MAIEKPDWNNANGMQLEMALDALLHAFPGPGAFEMFLLLKLNKTYATIAGYLVNYKLGLLAVITTARAEGWLEELIVKAQEAVPGNPRLRALRHLGNLSNAPPVGGRSVEDIIRQDGGFQDVIPWVRKLDRLTGQICRIESPINRGVGTGWLVANDLLLTNGHVAAPIIKDPDKAKHYVARFDYATDAKGTNEGTTFSFAANPVLEASPASPKELGTGSAGPTNDSLDYAVMRLAQNVGNSIGMTGQARGFIATDSATAVPADGSVVIVLQHPSGDPLALDLGTVLGVNGDGSRIKHNVSTKGGSSGSPCFNAKLELVALHNAGDPLYDGVHGAPKENHAVPIERILAALAGTSVPRFWN